VSHEIEEICEKINTEEKQKSGWHDIIKLTENKRKMMVMHDMMAEL